MQCNKKYFQTKSLAKRYIKTLKGKMKGVKCRSYKCPHCEGYHFTTMDIYYMSKIREMNHKRNSLDY